MTDALALDVAVHRFIDDVAPLVEDLLRALPGRDDMQRWHDTINEAFDLVCACIDADGLATDPELWALLKIFAPIMDSALLRSTPTAIREAFAAARTVRTAKPTFRLTIKSEDTR